MKTTLLSATALALILSGPALAADDHDHHGGGGPPAAAAHPAGGTHASGGGTGGRHTGGGNPMSGGTGGGTHHDHGNTATPLAPAGGGMMGGAHGGQNNRGTHDTTGGRHAGSHNSAFDSLRRAFNAPHRYHTGSYHRPSGWYAHRWNYGEFLPALFYSRNYWINDYEDYDLSDPPDGTAWVRYGDDALLIDEDSGEVIQVVYGIFY